MVPGEGQGEGGSGKRVQGSGFRVQHPSSLIPQPADVGRSPQPFETVFLPSFEQVSTEKAAFADMTRTIYHEANPYNGRCLVQHHGREAVVVNPPALPLTEAEMDLVYGLPFMRRPHPSYGKQRIPAFEVVKDSIQIVRGCFGGCAFCSITAHEGRVIQNRSEKSILGEIRDMAEDGDFRGVISDLGGPTANMYGMNCTRPEVREKCRRRSCLHPAICPLLDTDHGPIIRLMKAARGEKGVKQVFIASGIRMDLALRSPKYIEEVAKYHTGGLLKVAPEHTEAEVLELMRKPAIKNFEAFAEQFRQASAAAGKEQYLIPYFIAGHPGSNLAAMIRLALYLKRHGIRPDKVQDFIPGPMDIATCMYYTGLDPMTGKPVYVPRGARERRLHRALLQFFKPENYQDVCTALIEAGRTDLIGDGPDCLVPSRRPKAAKIAKKKSSPRTIQKHAAGYRPHRNTAKKRNKKFPK